jgi:flagellin-specific chaperone FliS
MRTERYRFTVWVGRTDHTKIDAIELYDHQNDPQENVNIAKDPANATIVERLMEQWKKGWQGAKASVAT